MAKIIAIRAEHPLVGTWITNDEDSDAAFKFTLEGGRFSVCGFCRSDGEAFEITEVAWDDESLSFKARMPSTNAITKNVFRIRDDGSCEQELTTYEFWKKKDVMPGDAPEAWRA